MIALKAALLGLFYALQLPLCVVAVAQYAGGARIGVGVSTLSPRFARSRALRRMHPPGGKFHLPMEKSGGVHAFVRGANYLYAHRLLLRISVRGEIGGNDAARIALCWGAAQSLLDTLSAITGGRIAGHLHPNFASRHCCGEIRVEYAVKTGAALHAALQVAGEQISEKVKAWTNIPSKA